MSSSDERKEAAASESTDVSENPDIPINQEVPAGTNPVPETEDATSASSPDQPPPSAPASDDPYTSDYDHYGYEDREYGQAVSTQVKPEAPVVASGNATPPPPPPSSTEEAEPEDDEEEGMLRMSFMEHLEELRSRLIKALAGFGVAFLISLTFAERLWIAVSAPAAAALTGLGLPPNLVAISPMEQFNTIWMKLPVLTSIFIASPWIVYQIWSFIAPGLYKRERRYAVPFVLCSAGLFIIGGLFAYFVAFRFGLTFLLGIGRGIGVVPLVSISEYFDLFVNVILGVALVFELPVLIFFLTLLRIASPRFLLRNSRYAILLIVVVAAIITPTPDVFNLTIFAAPMVALYFVGVFASYLLVLNREKQRFPWHIVGIILLATLLLIGGAFYLAVTRYGYKIVTHWPYLVR